MIYYKVRNDSTDRTYPGQWRTESGAVDYAKMKVRHGAQSVIKVTEQQLGTYRGQ